MPNKGKKLIPFTPGTKKRFVFPSRWGGTVKKTAKALPGTVCEVELPSRLHASVLDMNRFEPGSPGGGGIAFGVGLACRAKVSLTDGDTVESAGNRKLVARHFGFLFKELTGYRGGIEISTDDHGNRHMGLGSSIATTTAVATALNEALGRPLTLRDMRKTIAFNYCEEAPADPDMLVSGFETNLGAMVGLHGGMVVGSDACELLYRIPLPEDMKAFLVLPALPAAQSSGDEEAVALLGRAREADRRSAREKAYIVLMDLLPAMIEGDFEKIGDAVYGLARMGSKEAEIKLHGDDGAQIFETMARLRLMGSEIVCMSSVGPAVFALSRKPKVWREWKTIRGMPWASRTAVVPVDNLGARVKLDGVPISYRIEPWWTKPDYRARRSKANAD